MTDDTVEDRGARPRVELAAGSFLGRYRLQAILGTGGMGVVWSALDPDLDRAVAIKVLQVRDATPAQRTRLLREARAMARLRHPNVLTVYEVGSAGDRDFIAMERIDGGSLDVWLATRPPRAEVLAALLAAGRGLAAAHAAGLVHRDFKPHNVLRDRDGRVLVTDFGLARGASDPTPNPVAPPAPAVALEDTLDAASTPRPTDSVLDAPLTQTGALVGTPAYMAPEQLAGAAADARSDQFAFCVTLWQGLVGERPFRGTTLDELRTAVTAGIATDARVSPRLRAVLVRGLAVDPARRWPDMGALLAAIAKAERPRIERRLIAIGAALVVLGTGGAALRASRAEPAPCEPAGEIATRTPEATAFALRWYGDYAARCTRPAALGCLQEVRDEVALGARVPRLERCEQAQPFASPQPPANVRDDVQRVRAMLATATPAVLDRDGSVLRARAAGIDWPPLAAEIDAALGHRALERGDLDEARKLLDDAIVAASTSGHDRVAAATRIDIVAIERIRLVLPNDDRELERVVGEATGAVHHVGDEAYLRALLDLEAARIERTSAFPSPTGLGLVGATVARKTFVAQAMPELALAALGEEVDGDLRALYQDLGAVETALHETEPVFGGRIPPGFDRLAARVAWRESKLDDVHRLFDRAADPHVAAPGTPITGTVRRHDGSPAAGARVVAWRGTLRGDATRAFVDPSALDGDIAVAGADGHFAITVPAGGAVVAELGDLRAVPRLATGALDLVVLPTGVIFAQQRMFQLGTTDAIARFVVGTNDWFIAAPITPDGYRISGVPPGATPGTFLEPRERVAMRGPFPPEFHPRILDVIIRVHDAETAARDVWVFVAPVAPQTRAEVEQLARTVNEVAWGTWSTIGADATEPGRIEYRHDDRHAVFVWLRGGTLTVCAASATGPDAHVTCKPAPEPGSGEVWSALLIEPR